MKQVLIVLSMLCMATGAFAKGAPDNNVDIEAMPYSDGILFDVKAADSDLELSISGPGKMATSKRYTQAKSIFLETVQANGKSMPDGLYKYEARIVPTYVISREESSKMVDRNVLYGKTDAKSNPLSGTFRVVNGSIVDPELDEFGNMDLPSIESRQDAAETVQ